MLREKQANNKTIFVTRGTPGPCPGLKKAPPPPEKKKKNILDGLSNSSHFSPNGRNFVKVKQDSEFFHIQL